MEIVLVHPEIAPNTGAIIRLAANTGAGLHLVEPLGFELDDRLYSRGGLDYHELATVTVHPDLSALDAALPGTWWGFSAHGATRFTDAPIADGDVLVFGAERAGLGDAARDRIGNDHLLSIPMVEGSRSLNLANAVAVVVYDTWRRHAYPGAAGGGAVAEAPLQPPF
ncbi:MAG: tRNA (uridine(34)/cytosine(34)/5-carboxymethylaminomethyluridine(34)-2'-O)-methyltransferase TrmL [Acidimicrobiaceae bacterium]|nr:tRNA (uridine(34)/cytosine(34)/5-carboxymethylaminomethyluridine(34)-2'-O)-methyltransferase TrmL [Acidimicrobiaceae bacterium]HAB58888.1 tRNA (uridine(34)/cytosine(34)/5-carboxymethylaminomethyluridine(34)-2'-O)-methyltransferase TrmL [Acidimicrobiaceae bacterium]